MNTDQVRVAEKPQEAAGGMSKEDLASVEKLGKTGTDTSSSSYGQESISPAIVPTRSNTGLNSSKVSKKTSKKKKNACYFDKCSSAASKFIGDCNFCKGHFCSKHRLMENHACEGLTSCKEAMHKRNADKLAREQTRVPKIQI
ncbi:hypothetical protein HG536_0H02720 [Torulaspora globosa]|uniref:AN1-type domain-containing protein n=1 Tax=Torulaspora globosa TaxID=48254 RepID=A0A7G3ZN11_9SACH|nr:uncharacterized protein HG536_0H02720 [Torulaspora globosa]QLL34897.1 hypothetical protein HG536_0H02720 [Torulaspora globosa]